MQRTTRRFRPVLECLEDRLTPSSFTAVVTGTKLTITKTTTGGSGSNLVIAPAATFGELTVTSSAGDILNGSANPFTTSKPVATVVVALGNSGTVANSAEDTLTFDGSTGTGPINLTGGLSIAGTGGDKVLALTDMNLLHAAPLNVTLKGNGVEMSTFTNVNVGGAATITHPGVGNTTVAITNNAGNPGPNVVFNWGSLSITNGQGANVNAIHDTNFAGNVTINNGPGDGTTLGADGGSKNIISALNDQTLTTIGGSVTITTTSGMSDSELSDYNVHGNVTINTGPGIAGQTAGSIVDVENQQTVSTSGIPAIGGNVSITGTTAADATSPSGLTINVGASSNPLIMHGNLTVSATGTKDKSTGNIGSVTVNLTDLLIASGAASITIGGQTANDTVSINGANMVSHYGDLSITSNTGGNFNIQNMAGETDVANTVSLHSSGGTVVIGHLNPNPPGEDGTVHINGDLNITGIGTEGITVVGTRLSGTEEDEGNLKIALTGFPPRAGNNYEMNAGFTDTAISGAATISAPTYSGNFVTITTSGSASPNTVFKWGSLSITNGEDGTNTINDTDFAGNVTIKNAGNDDGDGINTTDIGAANDQNLATIGGNLTITNGLNPPSDTELNDYNVNGNVTIKSSPAAQDFVGLENNPTFPGSGIPVIDGNVSITAGSGSTRQGAPATIDVGTGGKDPYTYGNKATNNPLLIEGNLAITVTGSGMAVDLNDLSVANGTTSVTLGAGSGDTVQVQGSSSVTSVFDNFNITSSGTGGNTFANTLSIQDQAGTIEFGGAVNVQLAGTGNTLDLAADTNNSTGVAGAVVDFFSTSVFNGGSGTTSSDFEGTANTNLFLTTAPQFSHFH
jgi:hypothetical protein